MTATGDAKAALRTAAKARRAELDAATRQALSDSIAERAAKVLAERAPKVVALYRAIGSEADPSGLYAWAGAREVTVALPVTVSDGGLIFREHRPGQPLAAGPFGTMEPSGDAAPVQPEAIVVPLLAFDRRGFRLGYGKGHYDRAIGAARASSDPPLTVGFAFAAQEFEAIPEGAHDQRLDWIVTERETIRCHRRAMG